MSFDSHLVVSHVVVPAIVSPDPPQAFPLASTEITSVGISVQPARPYTGSDKSIVERTFLSVNTLFCQHVAGYAGRDTTRRGPDVADEAIWTVAQLQELFDEWVVACWQTRSHEGLSHTWGEGRDLSPNEMFAACVGISGYVPLPLTSGDYIELHHRCMAPEPRDRRVDHRSLGVPVPGWPAFRPRPVGPRPPDDHRAERSRPFRGGHRQERGRPAGPGARPEPVPGRRQGHRHRGKPASAPEAACRRRP